MAKHHRDFFSFREKIMQEQDNLSPRLREIGVYALENPDDMALQTVASLAQKTGVPASAFIRFANYFGFNGFSQMQQLYKNHLLRGGTAYAERIKALSLSKQKKNNNFEIINDFVKGSQDALNSLTEILNIEEFDKAIQILNKAETVWIMGVRRCYPLSSYFHYALSRLGKRNIILDGAGSMSHVHAQTMCKDDALLIFSFKDYAEEIQKMAQFAKQQDIPVIAITDSLLSPFMKLSDVFLEIHEVEVHAFRSLSTSMCLAVSMIVALGDLMQEADI